MRGHMRKLNDIVKLGFTPLNYGSVTECIIKLMNRRIPDDVIETFVGTEIQLVEKTYMEGMVAAMAKKALQGDARCFEILVNRVEGLPVQQPNIMQLMALLSTVPPDVLEQMLGQYQMAQDERRLLDASDSKPS